MKLSTKIAYNTIVQILSKVISNVIMLVIAVILFRELNPFAFGQYTTIITFTSLFAILADLGLTLVTVQMISKPKVDVDYVLGNIFSLRLISAILFLGLAPLAVLLFPYDETVKQGVLIISFSFLFIALNQVLVGLFQKKLRMDKVSIAEIVSRVVLLGSIIWAIDTGYGLSGILAATVLSSLISFLMHFGFSRNFAIIKLRFDFKIWKEIAKMSWPLAITIALNLIYLKTDTILLSLVKRPSKLGIMEEVGIYGAAYRIIDIIIVIPFMFAGIVLPLMAKYWNTNKKADFNRITQKSFNIMALTAVPIFVGTQFVATDVIILLAGEKFAPAGHVLKYLIMAACFIFLGSIFAHAIIAIDKQKKMIGAYLFVALTSVSLYFFVIPRFSMIGAACVTIYSEVVIALASLFFLWKYSGFFPKFNVFFKAIFSSLIMSVVLQMLITYKTDNLLILISSGMLVYFVCMIAIRGIEKEDLLSLINR